MAHRNTVSWNIVLSDFQRTNNTNVLFQCFLQMGRAGVAPNDYTLSILLRAVIGTVFDVMVPQVHAQSLHLGLNLNVFVGSSLIRSYARLRDKEVLCQVFDDILVKNVTSWDALVSGYIELGSMDDAQRIFDLMTERDVISWTAMISGYVKNMRFMDTLKLFLLMFKSGTRPNHSIFSSVLDACAGCSSLLMGLQVHLCIIKFGMPENVISLTSLVDMYAKCGDMDAAFRVFESIMNKNSVSWSLIIGGYDRHGLVTRALEEFERMEKASVTPDEIIFVNVLSACVHACLVEEGEKHFVAMLTKYEIQAGIEHYTCMVDLYGRAGQFDVAENLIKNMPFEPDVVLWGALLAACGLHSNIELGEYAAERIRKLERNRPVSYSMLSKIQGEKGKWSSELRDVMKERQAKKQKAAS